MIERNETKGNNSPIYGNDGDVIQNFFQLKSEVINPYNLKKVLLFLESELQEEIAPTSTINDDEDLKRINIIEKNKLNRLEQESNNDYLKNIIESSMYFKSIKDILSNPRNRSLKKSYNNIKKTINNKIPDIKRGKSYFFEVLNEVSVIIHFMYYICHIGENDAQAG